MVVSYLGGALRQRRTGLGWRGVSDLPAAADAPSLTVLRGARGVRGDVAARPAPGSQLARKDAVADLFGRATAAEQAWLRAIVTGNVRQGALDAVTQEAVAQVAGVPLAAVRRAAMLAGSHRRGRRGGVRAARRRSPRSGSRSGVRCCRCSPPAPPTSRPRWQSLSPDGATEVAIDAKLDGIRIQVHRDGDDVLVVTRSLDDITGRLPEVVEVARSLPAERFVLDGEALALTDDGRPMAVPGHREPHRPGLGRRSTVDARTSSTCSTSTGATCSTPPATSASPRSTRWSPSRTGCAASSPPTRRGRRRLRDRDRGRRPRGRRAQGPRQRPTPPAAAAPAWVKVKPVHTLDLVVLAVEWGSGRREGWLSNIHLGARDESVGDRLRDARQDLQGHDRRDARLADRALPRAGDRAATATSCTCAPSRSWRSPSTASSAPPATPAASRCASPGSCATATTRDPRGGHHRAGAHPPHRLTTSLD